MMRNQLHIFKKKLNFLVKDGCIVVKINQIFRDFQFLGEDWAKVQKAVNEQI